MVTWNPVSTRTAVRWVCFYVWKTMARKASHGWSTSQQGGFRRAGPAHHVFGRKHGKTDEINQNLLLHQASSIGAEISSHCQKCGLKKTRSTTELLRAYPHIKFKNLSQLNPVCENKACRGKIIILRYKLMKKSMPYRKSNVQLPKS